MADDPDSMPTLRIFTDDVDPEEVSRILGRNPDRMFRRGDPHSRGRLVRKSGGWFLNAPAQPDANLDAKIADLLTALPKDPAIWATLADRFTADIFCSYFAPISVAGIDIEPNTLRLLADRGLPLRICFYIEEEDPDVVVQSASAPTSPVER